MTEAPVTTGRRRSCIGPENTYRAFDDEVPDYGMITIYHNDDPDNDYTVPACKHRDRRDQCLRCSKLCKHGCGKVGCKLCNDWTCNVEGCLDKGRRFCSKNSLKHHTMHRCPRTLYMTWGGRVPCHLSGAEFFGQPIASRSESSAASESNVQ